MHMSLLLPAIHSLFTSKHTIHMKKILLPFICACVGFVSPHAQNIPNPVIPRVADAGVMEYNVQEPKTIKYMQTICSTSMVNFIFTGQ